MNLVALSLHFCFFKGDGYESLWFDDNGVGRLVWDVVEGLVARSFDFNARG
jgi:hypothetical protein